jgi:phosphoglycerol transferase MdoB-like AlkP superfamily enzyme
MLVGLIAGWLLTESYGLMPDAYTERIGNSVAGSDAIRAVLELLPLSSGAAEAVHAWVVVASITALPVFCISLIASGVYLWSRKGRLIVYSSLVVPIFMATMAVYYKYQLAMYDPLLACSFWNNAEGNIQGYFLSECLFVLAFAMIGQVVKLVNPRKSHGQRVG